jgi:hypothetical protein
METVIAHPESKEQLAALKAVMIALKISFEEQKTGYNPEFVAKILQGREDIKNGKGVKVDPKDLWK